MTAVNGNGADTFNRGTGLLVIEVRHSNPNGDPDAESEPRTIDPDGLGLISPPSFKRKLRDLVEDKEGPVWSEARRALPLEAEGAGGREYRILESRGRDREEIGAMDAETFSLAFWDGRVFGNTFLEEMKGKKITSSDANKAGKGKAQSKDHFIATGTVQFGPGVSICPIEVERLTTTNKSGVQEGKDRGMAPLGWRVVRHGVYAMPFFVNPTAARKTDCSVTDIDLLRFLIPHAYRHTASAIRPFVELRHAWYAEHTSPLGSCPDSLILDSMTPARLGDSDAPSTSIRDYEVPTELPAAIRERLAGFEDLCARQWR